MKLRIEELTPALWPALVELFGPKGACGGCWCMAWRLRKGEQYDEIKGEPARRRLKLLVDRGEALGLIAFATEAGEPDKTERPIGWCTFGPRPSFARLDRAPSLACDDASEVWSVPCFYIKRGWRNRGVATALLARAVAAARARGAKIVEGYPVNDKSGKRLVDTFSWTGTRPQFRKNGFRAVGPRDGGRQRMRRRFAVRAPKP